MNQAKITDYVSPKYEGSKQPYRTYAMLIAELISALALLTVLVSLAIR